MGSGNLCNWFPYARTLARKGFRVMAFDFRTYGISDIPARQANARRFDLDLIAAVKVLRKRGAKTVVLAGGSLGAGTVVVVGAQLQPPVQGVISLSAPLHVWDFDISDAARQLQVPVLFVAAEDDGEFSDDARSLYGDSSASDKQLLVVPEGGHGTNLVRGVAAVRNAVTAFFAAHA
jgi:pimeloyl-ACP methyl ester carboxylesterase